MNRRQENYLRMAGAVLKILTDHQPVWQKNKPFSLLVADVTGTYQSIATAQQASMAVSTGATTDKDQAAENAIELAVKLARFTQAYALDADNHQLHDQMKTSFRAMDRMPEDELAARLHDLHSRMNALDSKLVPYGVTRELLTELAAAISEYETLKPLPRAIVAERKGHNTSIPLLLRDIRTAFYKLDRLIDIWADTAPVFVQLYRNTRIVIDLRGAGEIPGALPEQ